MRELRMDSISEEEAMSKQESGKQAIFIPDSTPAFSSDPASIQYLCNNCDESLAELAPNIRLRVVLECPECGSFNDFPH